MTVTVLPIVDPDTGSTAPLAKVMTERLKRLAAELQETHLKALELVEPMFEDVVIYISYNSKFSIRWKVVNDVALSVENEVADVCGRLGYIKWKTATLNTFKGNP
jgi:hypothetical protein